MEHKEEERLSHPSFAQISFSRVQTTGADFYGSELKQDNFISMTIKRSEINRTLTKDWYFGKETLLKLRLSANQFSELITSMNKGDGVPCTLEFFNTHIEQVKHYESRKDFVHRKFEDRMKQFAKTLKQKQEVAKQLVKKKNLSKADIHDLNLHLDWLTQEVSSNIPFFAKCFQETMDEVVQEAKLEVENAIQHKISTLGLTELHNQQKLLK